MTETKQVLRSTETSLPPRETVAIPESHDTTPHDKFHNKQLHACHKQAEL